MSAQDDLRRGADAVRQGIESIASAASAEASAASAEAGEATAVHHVNVAGRTNVVVASNSGRPGSTQRVVARQTAPIVQDGRAADAASTTAEISSDGQPA